MTEVRDERSTVPAVKSREALGAGRQQTRKQRQTARGLLRCRASPNHKNNGGRRLPKGQRYTKAWARPEEAQQDNAVEATISLSPRTVALTTKAPDENGASGLSRVFSSDGLEQVAAEWSCARCL